jgi:hypothetical protein
MLQIYKNIEKNELIHYILNKKNCQKNSGCSKNERPQSSAASTERTSLK